MTTLTERKLSPLSVARAWAIMVLLQPGGPYSKTPRGGRIPRRENACGRAKAEAGGQTAGQSRPDLWVPEGPLNGFLQLLLDPLLPSNV